MVLPCIDLLICFISQIKNKNIPTWHLYSVFISDFLKFYFCSFSISYNTRDAYMILRTGDASPEGANIALAGLRIPEPRSPSTAQNFLNFTFVEIGGGGGVAPFPTEC